MGAQLGQDLLQGIGVEPVVGVDDLEVDAGGIADALVDALAVAAVLLMNDADDGGVLFGVGVGNFAGVVLGASSTRMISASSPAVSRVSMQ